MSSETLECVDCRKRTIKDEAEQRNFNTGRCGNCGGELKVVVPKITRYIPVHRNFDHTQPPVGSLEIGEENEITIKVMKDFAVNAELYTFAPSIVVKKMDKHGNILEAELDSISIIPIPRGQ